MNELRRMAYLDALGVDTYVSRAQLPGAAVTRRLAIVAPLTDTDHEQAGVLAGTPSTPVPSLRDSQAEEKVSARPRSTAPGKASTPARPRPQQRGESAPRFSLAAIVAGDWLWLEALPDMPLATEQVWLVRAMAQALASCAAHNLDAEAVASRPDAVQTDVAQFDWPIHTNQQLDLGEEAARAAVAGFVGRKLQQHQCRGVILLGKTCGKWVPQGQLEVHSVTTISSAEILARPSLKREAWRDLLPLIKQP